MGAEDLIINGKDVIVIEYHISDVFETSSALQRQQYYWVTALPTVFFDGVIDYEGGNNTTSMYETYLPLYETRKAILSSFSMDTEGANSMQTDYVVDISIEKVAANSSSNLALIVALTETEIPYIWMGQPNVNYCERFMLPDAHGTQLDFSSGDNLEFSFSFSIDPDWVVENCELVAWIQDLNTKEIHQGIKRNLTEFGGLPQQDVFLKRAYSPSTVCQNFIEPKAEITNLGTENLTSLEFHYQINDEDLQEYAWTGDLLPSATIVVDLPGVDFGIETSNSMMVYATNPNGLQDQFPYNDTTFNTIETAANVSSPVTVVLKLDDFPEETSWEVLDSEGTVLYSGGDYTEPGVFVTESLTLDEPDCYSFKIYDAGGNGLSGTGLFKLMYGTQIFYTGKDFGFQDEVQFGIDITKVGNMDNQVTVNIFPNPASDIIFINGDELIESLVVFSSDGRRMEDLQINRTSFQLTTTDYPKGNYIFLITTESGRKIEKIVIN